MDPEDKKTIEGCLKIIIALMVGIPMLISSLVILIYFSFI